MKQKLRLCMSGMAAVWMTLISSTGHADTLLVNVTVVDATSKKPISAQVFDQKSCPNYFDPRNNRLKDVPCRQIGETEASQRPVVEVSCEAGLKVYGVTASSDRYLSRTSQKACLAQAGESTKPLLTLEVQTITAELFLKQTATDLYAAKNYGDAVIVFSQLNQLYPSAEHYNMTVLAAAKALNLQDGEVFVVGSFDPTTLSGEKLEATTKYVTTLSSFQRKAGVRRDKEGVLGSATIVALAKGSTLPSILQSKVIEGSW